MSDKISTNYTPLELRDESSDSSVSTSVERFDINPINVGTFLSKTL